VIGGLTRLGDRRHRTQARDGRLNYDEVMGGRLAAERFEDEPPAEGVVIADRYELGSQLGIGGMGVVWRGRDRRLARAVAVKVLSKSSVGSEVARTRLIREARAAAALEHEGIIRVYDVGETDDGGAFLVMELVRGRSLRCVLETGTMKLGSRVAVIVQAARALHFAHDAGIVHRDVKPDNIMIREDGRVTVVDFGVAKPLSAELAVIAGTVAGTPPRATLTGPGQLVGTPAYLAPEQARGLDVCAATDQFALAVTAFEALTGKRPWTGACFSEVIASLLRDAPLAITEAAPLLPRALDEVFAHALAKSPSDRFDDIGAFADALEDAAVSLEVDAPVSLRPNSRRSTPSSSRTPDVTPPAEHDASVATQFSSSDAPPGMEPPASVEKRTTKPTGPSRYLLGAAAVGLVAVVFVHWSNVRTKPPVDVGANAPTASATPASPSVATLPAPTNSPSEASQDRQDAPVTSVATATAIATAIADPPASPSTKAAPTRAASAAPKPKNARLAAMAPPTTTAPPTATAPQTPSVDGKNANAGPPPAPSTTEVVPAPRPTGRRVRTEL
jgi:serine/threonine-protein kinase